jgi:hypothetical protein
MGYEDVIASEHYLDITTVKVAISTFRTLPS